MEDSYCALAWLAGHAGELGVDPSRIAVMGGSAGGGLAAGLALLARDRGGPSLCRQILLYPILVAFAGWSYDDNATGWTALLGDEAGGSDVSMCSSGTVLRSSNAAPGRLVDATGLPATYVEVGQLDIFRGEVLEYARTLSRGGVTVEMHLHPGVPHEYDALAYDADVAHRAQADRLRVLRSL